MGLLLLLTSTLLSSYFHPWRVVDAQALFTIKGITLSIEPSADVIRNTSVILKCQAVVSSSGQEPLSRHYTIYKDGEEVYTKTSSASEDLLYRLPEARVSNTGKYKCQITIEDKKMISDFERLTVTGLSVPEVHLNESEVSEGEEVTARCMAPGETGSIIFYFYEDSKEILEKKVNSNQTEVKLRFNSVGIHKVHCAYTVLVMPDSFKSKDSNTLTISVTEYPITLALDIFPKYKIYEGDRLDISCIIKSQLSSQSIQLFLSQGTQLLRSESTKTKVIHNMTALAKNSGEFECRLVIGNVVKVATKTISVTELFSVPILTMSPAEVFQNEYMKLTCKSESFASEKLRREELIYSLDPSENVLSQNKVGEFSGFALQHDLNYTCIARAKGIVKHSNTLTVRPKVAVSNPKISVVDKVVLKQPFKILCKSDNGSLPINYTLLKDKSQLSTISVKLPIQKALFTVTITHTDEISKYTCEAKNSHKKSPVSERLNATVIVPLSRPTLTVIPPLPEISEGDHLYLICGIQGTPPVTFKWYRAGNKQSLFTTTSNENHTTYQVSGLTKQHSGAYYCEANNPADNVVRSELVNIEVNLATWKKALIGGFCLLVVSVLVVVLVLCFRSKRGKREAAAELSVKPSSPKSDDSLRLNLTHDTEVYKAATDAAPHYDGMEGRVTNGTRDSVASLPADISNRSSYSIPATV